VLQSDDLASFNDRLVSHLFKLLVRLDRELGPPLVVKVYLVIGSELDGGHPEVNIGVNNILIIVRYVSGSATFILSYVEGISCLLIPFILELYVRFDDLLIRDVKEHLVGLHTAESNHIIVRDGLAFLSIFVSGLDYKHTLFAAFIGQLCLVACFVDVRAGLLSFDESMRVEMAELDFITIGNGFVIPDAREF